MTNLPEELEKGLQFLNVGWNLEALRDVEFLPGGYSNHNWKVSYAGQAYVVRIPMQPQPYVDRAHEENWYQRLPTSVGIKPIAFDSARGYMLSSWIEGVLLVDCWQDFTPDDLLNFVLELHRSLPSESRVYDVAKLLPLYSDEPLKATTPGDIRTTCHNDLSPWNVIVTRNGWITIDWEFVGSNDPLFDLVGIHAGLELEEVDLPSFVHRYLDLQGQTTNGLEQRLIECYRNFWAREYAWAHYQIQSGNDRAEILDQLDAADAKLRKDSIA